MKTFKEIILSLIIFIVVLVLIYKPLTENEVITNLPSLTTTDRLLKESLTLHSIGLIKEAEEKLEKAILRQPLYAVTHYFLAELYNEQGFTKDAIKEYSIVLRIDPEAYKSRVRLGELFYIEGNKDKSIEILKEAQEINPSNIEAYEILYSIFKKEGMEKKAEALLKEFERRSFDKNNV